MMACRLFDNIVQCTYGRRRAGGFGNWGRFKRSVKWMQERCKIQAVSELLWVTQKAAWLGAVGFIFESLAGLRGNRLTYASVTFVSTSLARRYLRLSTDVVVVVG